MAAATKVDPGPAKARPPEWPRPSKRAQASGAAQAAEDWVEDEEAAAGEEAPLAGVAAAAAAAARLHTVTVPPCVRLAKRSPRGWNATDSTSVWGAREREPPWDEGVVTVVAVEAEAEEVGEVDEREGEAAARSK